MRTSLIRFLLVVFVVLLALYEKPVVAQTSAPSHVPTPKKGTAKQPSSLASSTTQGKFDPAVLVFPTADQTINGGKVGPLPLTIMNSSNEDVTVALIPTDDRFLVSLASSFNGTLSRGGKGLLNVTYVPKALQSSNASAQPQVDHAVITVLLVGSKSSGRISFDAYGGGLRLDAPIKLTSTPVDPFPKVAVTGTATVTITNNGANKVHLSVPPKNPGDLFVLTFAGGAVETDIDPGQSILALITYTPADQTTKSGKVIVTGTSRSSTPFSLPIDLSGAGLPDSNFAYFATPVRVGDKTVLLANVTKGKTYVVWADSIGGYIVGQGTAADAPSLLINLTRPDLLRQNSILSLTCTDFPTKSITSPITVEAFHMPTARIIGGYQQGGASGADSSGRFFLDAYTEYRIKDSRFSFIGDSRIGSGAQDNAPKVSDFVAGLAGAAGTLALNKIATTGEAWAGAAFTIIRIPKDRDAEHDASEAEERAKFSIFALYGLNGYLQSGSLDQTFAFPANGTQANRLLRDASAAAAAAISPTAPTIADTCDFSKQTISGVADNCQFVRFHFTQPSFYQESYVGLRVDSFQTLFGTPPTRSARASLLAGVGFNEQVGKYRRPSTLRLEGFLPFAFPNLLPTSSSLKDDLPIYIFGTAEVNFHRDGMSFAPQNVISLDDASTVKSSAGAAMATALNTFIISTDRPRRDIYSFGVGIDLFSAYRFLFGSKN